VVGEGHYNTAQSVKRVLQSYKDLQDIIPFWVLMSSAKTRSSRCRAPARSRSSSRSRSSWPSIHRLKGRYVKIDDTVHSFQEIVDGKHDDIRSRRST